LKESDSPGQFSLPDPELALRLFGNQNKHLKQIEQALDVRIGSKGGSLLLHGEPVQIRFARKLLEELYRLLKAGYPLYSPDIDYAIRILQADSSASLEDVFLDTIFVSARKKIITPKMTMMTPLITSRSPRCFLMRLKNSFCIKVRLRYRNN